MSIVVTGIRGQLGHDIVNELISNGYRDIVAIDIEHLDITKATDVEAFFKENKPSVIIHCAAYTAVDNAEDNEEIAMNVNVQGTKNLVLEAEKYGAKFLYISTDYIFDGENMEPYEIFDLPNPLSIYGKSKYLGELETIKYSRHFIIRISWVFGKNGKNFVKTMLKLGNEMDSLSVVSDQVGSPTYTYDLAKLVLEIVNTEKYGIYHATNEGFCSWYDFAKEIFKLTNNNIDVIPISSNQYVTKAKRPMNSRLSKASLIENGFQQLPHWKDALKRYLKEIEVIE